MTKEALVKQVDKDRFAVITLKDAWGIFPGRHLSPVEAEFKKEFALAGGPMWNPTGTSYSDQLSQFLSENQMSYKMIGDKALFYRRQFHSVVLEQLFKDIAEGKVSTFTDSGQPALRNARPRPG